MIRHVAVPFALLLAAGCAAIPQKPVFLSGQWGGQGVDLLVEGGIGNVQFDCASGTIDANVPSAGAFATPGTFRPGQGGPVRVGQIFTSMRATYSGSVTGDRMTLSIRVEDGPTVGPLTLTRGALGQLNRCL